MLPILIPIVQALMGKGMTVLADAVVTKGKAWVEDKIGMKLPESVAQLTPELTVQLKQAEMTHEAVLVQAALEEKRILFAAEAAAGVQVTDRWKADMASDSWLSKNIRPMVLIFILSIYTIFALLSVFGLLVTPSYVELLGQWGMLIMSAYFVGRSAEKITATVKKTGGSE